MILFPTFQGEVDRSATMLDRLCLYNFWLLLLTLGNIMPCLGYNSQSETCSVQSSSTGSNVQKSVPIAESSDVKELSNIILFDGVCNLCNKWVDIMLQLDTGKKFKFCALQSAKGRDLVTQLGKNPDVMQSVILIKSMESGEIYQKSDAILKVTEQLGAFWHVFSFINSGLPLFVRDAMYDLVARNRYSVLGKTDKCRCATSDYSDRVI